MHKKQEVIIRYYRNGESISKIARELGICRKTVRRYLAHYSDKKETLSIDRVVDEKELISEIVAVPSYDSSNRQKRKLSAELVSVVTKCLEENEKKRNRGQHKQQMKKIDIFEYLRTLGFDISYSSICTLINSLEVCRRERFIKQLYHPGDVCEFDWAEVKLFIKDKLRTYQLAVFTSAYGNYRYAYLFPRQNTACFQEAHALFFKHLGAVYKTMVYDNTRVAVRKFVGPYEKEPTEALLQLSMYYQFDFRFCNVRAGNEKGHVERSVEYVRRRAFSQYDRFDSLEEANAYLLAFCNTLNFKPQKGKENRTAHALKEEEKAHMLASPPLFEYAAISRLRVDKYGTITVDSCHYSVPEEYTKKVIAAKVYVSEIICFDDDNKAICKHKKSHGLGEWIIDLDHYLKTLRAKPGAIRGSVAFAQMKEEYKHLCARYFASDYKDFIELLLYMKQKNIALEKVKQVIKQLESISPLDISTMKIRTILERNDEESIADKTKTEIDEAASQQLAELSQLIPQNSNLQMKEVIV
jgi:transposase